jgi:hypothetical protein
MPTNPPSRRQQPDLLVRPPSRPDAPQPAWGALVDPVAALAELADLLVSGLISRGEFARQAAKVVAEADTVAARHVDHPAGVGLSATAPPSCAGRHPLPRRASRRPACGRSSSGGT